MYQIACGIDFMHTGNKFRGTILHMDIKSKNVVLDAKFNARLIDFGLARELKEGDEKLLLTALPVGTPGYFPTVRHNLLTKQHDFHNFGVVLRELLTGLEPSEKEEGVDFRNWHKSLILRKKQESVWNNIDIDEAVDEIAEISVLCTKSVNENLETIDLKSITSKFKAMLRNKSLWDATDGDRCEICLVNKHLKVSFDGHDLTRESQASCARKIRTCCSCMRNSYINPVKCHTCGQTIEPVINAKWGALLLAGFDTRNGRLFIEDINRFKEVITSTVLPAMSISQYNIITVVPDTENGTCATGQIDIAFEKLRAMDITTLLFVYSGHKGPHDDLGQEDDNSLHIGPNEYFPLARLNDKLNTWKRDKPQFNKVIAFFDCCFPEPLKLESPLKLIQFNPTARTERVNAFQNKGSPCLQLVLQAFTATANGGICIYKDCACSKHLHGDFITLDDLWKYLNEHDQRGYLDMRMPHLNTQDISLCDTVLAYNYNFEVKFTFKLEWHDKLLEKTVHPRDFRELNELKLILAEEVMRHVLGIDQSSQYLKSKFADIISIEIYTGPRTKHIQEIETLEQLMLAWTSKRILRCTARLLYNINVGKPVGRCLKDVLEIRTLHRTALYKCSLTDKHLTKSDLVRYRAMVEKLDKTSGYLKEYLHALDMIIHHTQETRFQDNRLDITFLDLPNSFTLVHMSLVQTTGVQEVTQQ
ncbi:hypothetical protein DPMN_064896 [Dreissena polymorpha]|uniref:Protein kinase domain-containing protein n=2 Tax=Dreissena polymorpha TaxID=45954 RepID=A0A9D4CEG2_DREPO|nr:hypothetical protein DPMN_064896 [Dreissena polymorpha]